MAKEKLDTEKIEEEAKSLGVKKSRTTMAGFKDKDPAKIAKETAKHDKLANKRLESRIDRAKADAKLKPIDKRRMLLVARFRAVKSRHRPNTYSDANIKAWIEELEMINNNPKSWNKITANGTIPFTPANKKKRTARDILESMDLE